MKGAQTKKIAFVKITRIHNYGGEQCIHGLLVTKREAILIYGDRYFGDVGDEIMVGYLSEFQIGIHTFLVVSEIHTLLEDDYREQ